MPSDQSKRVVLLAGGRSSEREVSLVSGEAVAKGLHGQGHDVVRVEIGRDGRWFQVVRFGPEEMPTGEPIAVTPGEGLLGADVVFPVLHGPFGEDGVIQGTLDSLEVAYVGSGVAASAICLDKLLFKEVAGSAGFRRFATPRSSHQNGTATSANTPRCSKRLPRWASHLLSNRHALVRASVFRASLVSRNCRRRLTARSSSIRA